MKKSKPEVKAPPESATLAIALNRVLTGEYQKLETGFIDAAGAAYRVKIYDCGAYVRADFRKPE
jgi:hypothetical protein